MKKILSILLLSVMIALPVGGVLAEEDANLNKEKIEIHVSPYGNDLNKGSVELPLKTLAGARKAVANVKNGKTPVEVIFHEGVYRFSAGVTFSANDSGTEKAPITYRSAEGEDVIFKGSVLLDATKFEPVRDRTIINRLVPEAAPYIGQLDLKAQGIKSVGTVPVGMSGTDQVAYNQFYLDGEMQTLSRWPNDGYAVMEKVLGKSSFKMAESNASRWANVKDAVLGGYPRNNYAYDRTPVTAIDIETRQITIDSNRVTAKQVSQQGRYFIHNLLEEIDMPGEWYIDKSTMMLYYYPMFPLGENEFEMATLRSSMITLNSVKHLNFKGIKFEQTCGEVFTIDSCKNVTWDGNEFRNIGRYGIEDKNKTTASNRNLTISNNKFVNIGSSPLRIAGGDYATLEPSGIVIYNNYFNNFGYGRKSYSGISIEGVGTKVLHNVICGAAGAALQPGGNNHEIMYNEIYDVCNEASDMGAIYTGRNLQYRRVKVMYNYIHDIIPDPGTAGLLCGVYWDDKMSGHIVQYNIFENIPRAVFMNGGSDHIVSDNIFVDNPSGIQVGTGGNSYTASQSYFVEAISWADDHPVYYEQYPEMKTLDINYTIPRRNEFHNNLYVNTGNNPMGVNSYIQYGEGDYASRFENNLALTSFDDFNNKETGDYSIKSDSEMIETYPELAKIKMEEIGLEGDMKGNWQADEFRKIHPKNGQNGVSAVNVKLMWQIPENACNYKVVVATDPELENIVWETKTAFNYACPENIESGGKTYYWNVTAFTNSATRPLEYASKGSVYSFKTAVLEQLDQTVLSESIKKAEEFSANLLEGEEVGQVQQGKLQPYLEVIENAKMMNHKRYGLQQEVNETNANLLMKTDEMQQYIHKGYADFGKYLTDSSKWKYSVKDSTEFSNGVMTINSGYVATAENTPNYEVFRFKIKLTGNKNFASIGLRQNTMGSAWSGGMINYTVFVKNSIFEFQRYTGHGGGIIETEDNNGILAENQWHEVEIAALDVTGGIQFFFRVDGKEIFNYFDDSGIITKPGMLQIGLSSVEKVELAESDKTDLFDESTLKTGVKIYSDDELVDAENTELLKIENYVLTNAIAEKTAEGLLFKGEKKGSNIAFGKKYEGNEIYTFDAKLNISEGTQGYKLRSSYLEQSPESEEGYRLEINNETISLKRFSAAGNQILCVYDNHRIKSGEWHNYKLGAYPTDKGMRVLMYVDGEKVVDYTDIYSKIQSGYLKFTDDNAGGIEIRVK